MECKVENLHYLDPLKKFNNVGENYSEVKNFLEKLNIYCQGFEGVLLHMIGQ